MSSACADAGSVKTSLGFSGLIHGAAAGTAGLVGGRTWCQFFFPLLLSEK
jgi:hypothetical protein